MIRMLFEEAQKEDRSNWEFRAALVDKKFEVAPETPKEQSKKPNKSEQPMFMDPEDYKGMTDEERKEETQRMLAFFKTTNVRSPKSVGL